MTDLITWLTAQLDEHERIALAAQEKAPAPWTSRSGMVVAAAEVKNGAHHPDEDLWDSEGSDTLETNPLVAVHIALHDPAAVLADIASKRLILSMHAPDIHSGETCVPCMELDADQNHIPWPCPTMRALATAFRYVDGYRAEWAYDA